ncbi:hypothetical protein [Salinigranum halophilum]|jgi:hypothetical protein|uniref:hypothetical protein n=1 Tax=Salinigranum halophilum TaxID=2565931 RepID=UPI0010A8CD27|nr:hypothetical protein [Salinigranum halophilum]
MPDQAVVRWLLVALALCAGCASPSAPQPSTPTDALPPSTTDTAATTRGAATDCPPTLQVTVATDSQRSRTDRRVEFAALAPARQREFEAALANGTVELDDALPEPWSAPLLVEYRGEQYYAVAQVC